MKRLLYQLALHGDISWLSYHFAEFIATQAAVGIDDSVSLTAALVSEQNQLGSVCINLDQYVGRPLFNSHHIDPQLIPVGKNTGLWRKQLLESRCVAAAGTVSPLTLEDDRLYLNRFWFYENCVAKKILQLLQPATTDESAAGALEDLLGAIRGLDRDQKNAVRIAASRSFCVVSGGPGSGKTSTVIRILSVLLSLDPGCRIALAAPTGKAAARMVESIRHRLDQTDIEAKLKRSIPLQARTLHRLLGYRGHQFNYDAEQPLPLDCLVIDEASMIDLKLMHHLLAALPAHARLILLGDRDQLASVAAGNLLGDITGHGYSLEQTSTPLVESIALLKSNYRFAEDSDIGELAARVNQGQTRAAIDLLSNNAAGLHWYPQQAEQVDAIAIDWLSEAYQGIFDSADAADALQVYETTRVLCATNQGPLGVDSLNQLISARLLSRNDIAPTQYYHGLPIMITRNHQDLGLYNGDTGILWRFDSALRACFRTADGSIRDIAINRLPEFRTAWASTVHKSQGSEFDSVLLILPLDRDSEALSREMLYTAITRARRQFRLQASEAVVKRAIDRLTRRHSGLAQKLGWPD